MLCRDSVSCHVTAEFLSKTKQKIVSIPFILSGKCNIIHLGIKMHFDNIF